MMKKREIKKDKTIWQFCCKPNNNFLLNLTKTLIFADHAFLFNIRNYSPELINTVKPSKSGHVLNSGQNV